MQLQPYKLALPLRKLRHRIRQQMRGFLGLSALERRLLLSALILLPGTVVGLRLFGFKRWYGWLQWSGQWGYRRPAAATEKQAVRRTLLLLRLAIRYAPHRGNCLSQSLTLWWLLQRQGLAGDLRIGVRQQDGVLQAHAWIEYGGQPLNDSLDVYTRYAVFTQVLLPVSAKFL